MLSPAPPLSVCHWFGRVQLELTLNTKFAQTTSLKFQQLKTNVTHLVSTIFETKYTLRKAITRLS